MFVERRSLSPVVEGTETSTVAGQIVRTQACRRAQGARRYEDLVSGAWSAEWMLNGVVWLLASWVSSLTPVPGMSLEKEDHLPQRAVVSRSLSRIVVPKVVPSFSL